MDVNDNSLVVIFLSFNIFFKLVFFLVIFGFVVVEVFVVDIDIGMNVEFKYIIVSGNNKGLFRIDLVIGNIILEEKLVFIDVGLYRLVVNISDLGYFKFLYIFVFVFFYVNDIVGNVFYIYDLIRRIMEILLDRNIGDSS